MPWVWSSYMRWLRMLMAHVNKWWQKLIVALLVFSLAAGLWYISAVPIEALGERWGLEESSILGMFFHLAAHLPPELLVHSVLHAYLHQRDHHHSRTLHGWLSNLLSSRFGKTAASAVALTLLVFGHAVGHSVIEIAAGAAGAEVPELVLYMPYLVLECMIHIGMHKWFHRGHRQH